MLQKALRKVLNSIVCGGEEHGKFVTGRVGRREGEQYAVRYYFWLGQGSASYLTLEAVVTPLQHKVRSSIAVHAAQIATGSRHS